MCYSLVRQCITSRDEFTSLLRLHFIECPILNVHVDKIKLRGSDGDEDSILITNSNGIFFMLNLLVFTFVKLIREMVMEKINCNFKICNKISHYYELNPLCKTKFTSYWLHAFEPWMPTWPRGERHPG